MIKQFSASQSADSAGDGQSCSLDLASLKQVPDADGLALSSGPNEGEGGACIVRFSRNGDQLQVRFGDPSQAGSDCKGSGDEMFCSPRAMWSSLSLNVRTHRCEIAK